MDAIFVDEARPFGAHTGKDAGHGAGIGHIQGRNEFVFIKHNAFDNRNPVFSRSVQFPIGQGKALFVFAFFSEVFVVEINARRIGAEVIHKARRVFGLPRMFPYRIKIILNQRAGQKLVAPGNVFPNMVGTRVRVQPIGTHHHTGQANTVPFRQGMNILFLFPQQGVQIAARALFGDRGKPTKMVEPMAHSVDLFPGTAQDFGHLFHAHFVPVAHPYRTNGRQAVDGFHQFRFRVCIID